MTTINWSNQVRPNTVVGGWTFNEDAMTFNTVFDYISGDSVMFNGSGLSQTWTNQTRS